MLGTIAYVVAAIVLAALGSFILTQGAKIAGPVLILVAVMLMIKIMPAPATELPVQMPTIGETGLTKNTAREQTVYRRLMRKCNDANPPKNETDAQFLRRLSLPCPGRLE